MNKQTVYYAFCLIGIFVLFGTNSLYGQEPDLLQINANYLPSGIDTDPQSTPTPTPLLIVTGGGPTPTPTFNPNDIDGDGIPNGLDSDVDGDGIPNGSDPDIDGDGLNNNVDSDMDGDGIPNVFDPDANGDGQPDAINGDSQAVGADTDDDSDGTPDEEDATPKGAGSEVSGTFVNNAGDYSPWHEIALSRFVQGYEIIVGWDDTVRLLRNSTDSNTIKVDINSYGNNCYVISDSGTISIATNNFKSDGVLNITDTSNVLYSTRLKLYYGIQGDEKTDLFLDEIYLLNFPCKLNFTVGVYRISWFSNNVQKNPLTTLNYVVNAVESSYENKYWEPGAQVTFEVIESLNLTIPATERDFSDNDLDMVGPLNPILDPDENAVNAAIYSNTNYEDSDIDIRIITIPGSLYVIGTLNDGQVKGNWAYISCNQETNNTPAHEIGHIIGAWGHNYTREGSLMHGNPTSVMWYLLDQHWATYPR